MTIHHIGLMYRPSRDLTLGLLVLCALGSLAAAQEPVPLGTSVCDLSNHPMELNKKLVSLSGMVKSDGIEHTVLVDESCPSRAVALWIPNEASKQRNVVELVDGIYRHGRAGTIGKRITGDFVGTYSWQKNRSPRGIFKLSRVIRLDVQLDSDLKER